MMDFVQSRYRGPLDGETGILTYAELLRHRWFRDQYRWAFREVREGRMQDPFEAVPKNKRHLRAIVNVLHEDWKVRAAAAAAKKPAFVGVYGRREHEARCWRRPKKY